MEFWWPIALVVACNALYQICSKSVPAAASPFLAVAVTYAVACLACLGVYLFTNGPSHLGDDFRNVNWASPLLGLVVIGLEIGFLFAYRAGWTVSTAATVQGAILAVVLVAVGYFAFKESITLTKLLGIAVSLVGIYLINR